MSDIAAQVVDRLEVRKKLGFWKKVSFFLLGLVIMTFAILGTTKKSEKTKKPHLARVTISGMITDQPKMQELLEKLAEDKNTKAVILRINSPGGSTTGGEMLYEGIRKISKEKPVTAVFGTVAASAAYMAGIASDHIIARGSTITGSVGVLFQWPDVSGFLRNHGIKFNVLKSGKLKAVPSPFQPADENELAVPKEIIQDSYDWFISLVETRRKIEAKNVEGLTQGRVFTGRQALRHKLIDEIGGEREAVAWLEKKKKIAKDLKIIDRKPKKNKKYDLFTSVIKNYAQKLGISDSVLTFFIAETSEDGMNTLNGLLSVWRHPVARSF